MAICSGFFRKNKNRSACAELIKFLWKEKQFRLPHYHGGSASLLRLRFLRKSHLFQAMLALGEDPWQQAKGYMFRSPCIRFGVRGGVFLQFKRIFLNLVASLSPTYLSFTSSSLCCLDPLPCTPESAFCCLAQLAWRSVLRFPQAAMVGTKRPALSYK